MPLDGTEGVSARLAVRGTGMVPVQVQWFEGAGDGKSFRGGRTLGRAFDMPVRIQLDRDNLDDRSVVQKRIAKLAQILSIENAPARLTLDLNAGGSPDRWWADMVKVGGGDWSWETDTDGSTFVHTVVSLEAGDPYWTSVNQQSRVISPAGVGLGLLGPNQSLSELILATSFGTGATEITNDGDVRAYPIWRINAPFTEFTLVSQWGETLKWVGNKTSGYIEVNTKLGTVEDETGANMYANLDPAPRFWSVRPGSTTANIQVTNPTSDTIITATWNVRREVLF